MSTHILKPVYCADAIVLYKTTHQIVIVNRLGSIKGLALPGGKQDPGESLTETVIREVAEETGLVFTPSETFGAYADLDRDPRGHYVSTVFIGNAEGDFKDELGKTEVRLYDLRTFNETRNLFAFDHATIIADYLRYSSSKK